MYIKNSGKAVNEAHSPAKVNFTKGRLWFKAVIEEKKIK